MNITLFGIIIILTSIYAFFKNQKLLLYMLIFFSTFTAAELLHVEFIRMPLLAFEYIGAVWLLREFINLIKSKPKFNIKEIINKFKENKLAIALVIFMFTILFGVIYLFVSGLNVEYTDINGEPAILKFSFGNIKQILISEFVLLLMVVLSFKIKTKEEIKEFIKIFGISTIFAIIWGLLQFITYYFKIPYPAFLFNNNVYASQGFMQITNNIKRISSISLEPSTFAVNLTCFIPFALGAFLQSRGSFKDKKNIILFVVIIMTTTCAILTTASSAYVGLLVSFGLYGLYILFGFIKSGDMDARKSNFLKMFVVTILSISLAGAFCWGTVKIGYKTGAINYIVVETPNKAPDEENNDKEEVKYNSAFDNIINNLKQMTIYKFVSNSGQERTIREIEGFKLFKYSPIVGIGIGSFRTFSLFTNILVNTGILGCTSFIGIIVIVLKALIQNRKKDEVTSIMLIISIISTSVVMFVGVPDFIYIYYWIMLVLGYKYAKLDKS